MDSLTALNYLLILRRVARPKLRRKNLQGRVPQHLALVPKSAAPRQRLVYHQIAPAGIFDEKDHIWQHIKERLRKERIRQGIRQLPVSKFIMPCRTGSGQTRLRMAHTRALSPHFSSKLNNELCKN